MKRVENRNIERYHFCSPRGPVIGPLVIAGITLEDDSILIENKVKDSKKISPSRRKFLANKIQEIALDKYILIIPARDIDDMRKVMTLNEIEVNAYTKIIKKLKPEVCYVDSVDVNEERFGKDIQAGLTRKIEIISKHKADDIYPVVSAASIIAKTRRDEEVQKIGQKLGAKLNLPLGSGYPADPITQKFLKTWIDKYKKLPPHTRHSWKTIQNILKEKSIKKLDDF
jgi:ribonuclease HII